MSETTVEVNTRDAFFALFPQGLRWIEIGVDQAENSERILRETQPEFLWLVDWYEHVHKDEYSESFGTREAHIVAQRKLATNTRCKILPMSSIEAAAMFPDGFFDVVYIDGNHDDPWPTTDIKLWLPKTKKSGFLAGHDLQLHGPKAATDWFRAETGLDFCARSNVQGVMDWAFDLSKMEARE